MVTFLMFGNYSSQSLQQMSADRTTAAVELIGKFGGEVQSMYAVLGQFDLVLVVWFPGVEDAMKASVALSKMTGIAFSTAPAVTVEEFDQLMADV
jgi:uncharacterized protein with GYD domain